ncbi:MAG TPA: SPFH domain-containing protein [Phycisphaerae bacterium]|nr:SPFH domain-containing protein [Phycisphaerae bacterium]
MTSEFERVPRSGWAALALLILASFGAVAGLIWSIHAAVLLQDAPPEVSRLWPGLLIVAWALSILVVLVLWCGLFTLQPNAAAVLVLFGEYRGTARKSGFYWANPFLSKIKVSLRARNLNGDKLKVNDQRGNPIEIAAVVVWRVHDTARAIFDVDHYENYVTVQSESAVRHLASRYPYDTTEEHQISLRGSIDEVSHALQEELHERLTKAGVVVEEARLSHLAYAPEIAGAMLRRQQAEAVVAARTRIVEGAVGMVHMALEHLEKGGIVELDTERKAAMVSNLLVVLCGEQGAQPVVNAGTLYT